MDERLRLAREEAAMELAELRRMDARELTPRMLVRKAILLQFDDTPDGTPHEIESVLQAALNLDEKCIEAHVELGWYYYAVLDDSGRAKSSFLSALDLLKDLNKEVVKGLLECDAELQPHRDLRDLQTEYEAMLLSLGDVGDMPPVS